MKFLKKYIVVCLLFLSNISLSLASEINIYSIVMIFIFSLTISALASYLPAMAISKMKTFRALKYD